MKKQFKVNQNGLGAFRKRLLLTLIPSLLLLVFGAFAIIQYTVSQPLNGKSLFFAISLVLGSMAFGLIISFKPQLKLFSSYTITLDDEILTRTRDNTPTIQIPLNEITQIIQTKYKNIIIKGKKTEDTIYLLRSTYLENHDELVEELLKIMPFSKNPQYTLLERFAWTLPILVIASMLSLFLTQNKIIAILSTITIIGTLLLSFRIIQKSKDVDSQLKNRNWAIILAILLILGYLWYKFSY